MGKYFLSMRQVCERTSLSRTTIYNLVRDGLFPNQVSITTNRVAWTEDDVDRWMVRRVMDSCGKESDNAKV